MPVEQWEHAVLRVEIVSVIMTMVTVDVSSVKATAWVDDREIYSKTMSATSWSVPLADLGRQGWELVGTSADNAVFSHSVRGWTRSRDASMPIAMTFFLKRPLS